MPGSCSYLPRWEQGEGRAAAVPFPQELFWGFLLFLPRKEELRKVAKMVEEERRGRAGMGTPEVDACRGSEGERSVKLRKSLQMMPSTLLTVTLEPGSASCPFLCGERCSLCSVKDSLNEGTLKRFKHLFSHMLGN